MSKYDHKAVEALFNADIVCASIHDALMPASFDLFR